MAASTNIINEGVQSSVYFYINVNENARVQLSEMLTKTMQNNKY